MQTLSQQEFDALTKNATMLTEDEYGKKVLELADHSILKLFRVKRFISQATLYSPARRFANNTRKLHKLNIPTIKLIALYKIKAIQRTAVHYQQLEGMTLRHYLHKHPHNEAFLAKVGQFIAHLHNKGIYFRAAHFGNIIVMPNQQLGLIDISDMSISPFSLGYFKRIRNLKHIFRIAEDINLLQGSKSIEQSYLQHCSINNPLFVHKFLQTSQLLKSRNA